MMQNSGKKFYLYMGLRVLSQVLTRSVWSLVSYLLCWQPCDASEMILQMRGTE